MSDNTYNIDISEYLGYIITCSVMGAVDGYLTDANGDFVTDEDGDLIPIL